MASPASRGYDQEPHHERRHFTRSYLLGNSFEFCAAIAAAATAIVYLADPNALRDASIGQGTGTLALAWNLMYLAGGLGVVAGLVRGRYPLELAGLCVLCSAGLVNATAVLVLRGSTGIAVELTNVGFAAAGVMRAYLILRLAGHGGGEE